MKVSAGPFKALIIDWDGTLIDSLPLKIENAAALFCERFGLDEADVAESYARHSGVPRRILFDRISFDCRGSVLSDAEFDSLSSAFTEQNNRRIAAEGDLRPGTMSTLSRLRELGVLLYISTAAAQEEIDSLARHFGLARVCDGIFGSRPTFSKGPDHANAVIERHGLRRSDVAGIGDDTADMELFRESGIFPMGITGTRSRAELQSAGAEVVVDRLEDVVDYVN